MRGTLSTLILALVVSACGGDATTSSTIEGTTTSAGATATTAANGEEQCPESIDFVAEGRVLRLDQTDSDATSIGLITWEANEDCERIVIDFQSLEGAPATTPPNIVVRFLETLQILRVDIGADDSIIIDQLVGTPMVDRLYVVKKLKEGSYVDFHLREPVRAKARVAQSPARLIIDIRPAPEAFLGSAAISDTAVMVTPVDEAVEPRNLEVSGYAISATGEVTVIATSGGNVVAQEVVPVSGHSGQWSEFRTRLDVKAGMTTIFAGEPDPGDGSLNGITVGVQVR